MGKGAGVHVLLFVCLVTNDILERCIILAVTELKILLQIPHVGIIGIHHHKTLVIFSSAED